MRIRPIVFLVLALGLFSPAAFAQGTYVSASVIGDISRFSRATSGDYPDPSGSGEAIGFALRLGTPVAANWGVEVEFARPSEIREEGVADTFTIVDASLSYVPSLGGGGLISGDSFVLSYGWKTWRRTTTLSTSAWVRQELSNRVSLVYLGGLGFTRTQLRSELTFLPLVFPGNTFPPSILPASQTTEALEYGAHPLAGVEARIGLTSHIELVPGIRLLGLDNGWLVRPSVGLGWSF